MRFVLATLALLLAVVAAGQTAIPIENAARANNFKTVTADLDAGGSVFAYLSTERIIADAQTRWNRFLETHRKQARNPRTVEEIDRFGMAVDRLVSDLGIDELAGVGISAIATSETRQRSKVAVYHGNGEVNGLLWMALGTEAKPLEGVKRLPATTACAVYTRLELPLLWAWLNDFVGSVAGERDRKKWERGLQWWRDQGVDWHQVVDGVDGEILVAITLDPDTPIMFERPQDGQEAKTFPTPGFLVAVKTRDSRLLELFDAQSTQRKWPVTAEDSEDLRLRVGPTLPLPIPFQPCVAQAGDTFYIASRPQLIQDSLAVYRGEAAGLAMDEDFLALAKDLPGAGNQVLWMSRTFSESIVRGLRLAARGRRDPNSVIDLIEPEQPTASLSVIEINANGLLLTNNTDGDARWAVMQLGVIPGALAAVMAGPMLHQARGKAQRVNSAGNLKQMGLACLMWSGDHDGQFPTPDGIQGFQALVDGKYIAPQVFGNPRRGGAQPRANAPLNEDEVGYVYFGAGTADNDPMASQMPVAFEKPQAGDNWMNVLYVDGHVQGFTGTFRNCQDVVNFLNQRHPYPEAVYARLTEKAAQLDQTLGYPRGE